MSDGAGSGPILPGEHAKEPEGTKGFPNEDEPGHLEVPPHGDPEGNPVRERESSVQPTDPEDEGQTGLVRESEQKLQHDSASSP